MKLLPKNLYSRLTLITVVTVVTGYAIIYAYTAINSAEYASGAPLTSTLMGKIVGNLDELNTKISNFSFSSGNVGIGIATPARTLDVQADRGIQRIKSAIGTNPVALYLENSGTDFWMAREGSVGGSTFVGSLPYASLIYSEGNYPLQFATNSAQRMIIDSTGNVGIGTSAPATKLSVSGNIRNNIPTSGYIELSGDLPGYPINTRPTLKTSGANLYFSAGGVYSAYMTTGGTWTVMSDKNKKENIVPLNYVEILNKIDQLPINQWTYKAEDASIRHIGPFAQDFHALFDLNGPNDKMISTTDPSGVALAGIKGLIEKNKIQEEKINKLENDNNSLKSLICQDHPTADICK